MKRLGLIRRVAKALIYGGGNEMRLRLLPNYYIRQSSRYKAFDFGNKKSGLIAPLLFKERFGGLRGAALSR